MDFVTVARVASVIIAEDFHDCRHTRYAHAGHYFTQHLVSMSMPLLVMTWLLVIASDPENHFRAFQVVLLDWSQ